jgi:uncharacterized protein
MKNIKYLLAGIYLGIIFVKSQITSWMRIMEMFRMESFHMYGIIITAIITAIIGNYTIKKTQPKTLEKETITFETKEKNKGQIYGAFCFGVGWALTGACPGPLYAQIGAGFYIALITLFFAVLGTWTYGYFKNKLPH